MGFERRTKADWSKAAELALKGKPLDALTRRTYGGVRVEPLYTQQDDPGPDAAGLPGQAPFVRGTKASALAEGGWRIRQIHDAPTPERVQAALLEDLERGVEGADLRFDRAVRAADAEAGHAEGGAALYTLADLDRALDGVREDLAEIGLDAGASGPAAAVLLTALWARRGRDPRSVRAGLGVDPLGALAREGRLPGSAEDALAKLGGLGRWAAGAWPGAQVARADATPYHDAGASEVEELACLLATGVTYLYALGDAGLSVGEAARQVDLRVAVSARMFDDIAKLRAARRLWARALEALGAEEAERGARLEAVMSRRGMTRRDPWVNMLRGTAACFAGAVGGADAIVIHPFESEVGPPTGFGRRIARNTQVVLQEESHLGAVLDPGGGAWYLESLTDGIARAAWARFQEIEQAGGMTRGLLSGEIARRIVGEHERRSADLAKRRLPVTGVSEFPNLDEPTPKTEPVEAEAQSRARARLEAAGARFEAKGEDPFAAAFEAATAGASVLALAAGLAEGEPARVEPLPLRRDAAPFEALRDASDAAQERPKVLLVNLGPVAEHTARATWARNFFGAGGVEAVDAGGFDSPEDAAEAARAHGARLAVLCGKDERYEEAAPAFAPALAEAGVTRLYVAGHPKKLPDAVGRVAHGFIHMGCDVLGTLQDCLTHLGAIR